MADEFASSVLRVVLGRAGQVGQAHASGVVHVVVEDVDEFAGGVLNVNVGVDP